MAYAGASRSVNAGSDQCHMYECDPCKFNDVSREAKCYCKVCTEYLCSLCERSHKGSKATRNHTLVSGEDLHTTSQADVVLPMMFCDEHKKNVFSLLCKNHNVVICDECKTTTHRKCIASDLSDNIALVQGKGQFKATTKKIADVIERCRELISRREKDGNKADSEKEKCVMEMRNIRKEVNAFFDKEEERLTADIKKEHSKILKEVENDLKTFESIYKQTEAMEPTLRDCKATGNDKAMLIAYMKSKGKLEDLEKCLDEVCGEVKPIALKFQPNDKVKRFFDKHYCVFSGGIGKVVGREDKEDDFERWVKTLPLAVIESYHNIVGDGISEAKLLPALQSSGLAENLAKWLAGRAKEAKWPSGIGNTDRRWDEQATFKRFTLRKVPGFQACVVGAFENTHMPDGWTIKPGFILTFNRGVDTAR